MSEQPTLSSDRPLNNPDEDQLGYAGFAEHLAKSVVKMLPPEGLVIALYGPWGSGKSTVLNFVTYYLEHQQDGETPVIAHFNPWWFSGQEDLIRNFFGQLQAVLSSKSDKLADEIQKKLGKLAGLVSKAPTVFIPYGEAITRGADLANKILTGTEQSVAELKNEISVALKQYDKRVLIVIDDIDRLTAEEIRQLFRLIKAVADFPNVVYLLAFDKEVVIEALKEMQGLPGEKYLEKIVQVPLELPDPDYVQLEAIFRGRLVLILAATEEELLDLTYWENVYQDGIRLLIKTPRDVFRLTNTLRVTYPQVIGEVNPVDFVAIEALRVFHPDVYEIVRNNREMFARRRSELGSVERSAIERFQYFHQEWMSGIANEVKQPIQRLLTRLFPELRNLEGWGYVLNGRESDEVLHKKLRICSPSKFNNYFRLSVQQGDISNTEMKDTLSLAKNPKNFEDRLIEYSKQQLPTGIKRIRIFLDRIWDYIDEIPPKHFPTIIAAFFDLGDQFLNEPETPFSFSSHEAKIWFITLHLLSQIQDEEERFTILRESMSAGRAIFVIVDILIALGRQHGRYEGRPAELEANETTTILVDHVDTLEAIVLEKVRTFTRDNLLLQAPRLRQILAFWRDLAGENEVRAWVTRIATKDASLIQFIGKFQDQASIWIAPDRIPRTRPRVDPKWIEPYLDPAKIIGRVRNLAESDEYSDEQRACLQQFILEYEIRERGSDPNEELKW